MQKPLCLHLCLSGLFSSSAMVLEPPCQEGSVGKDSCEEQNEAEAGLPVWLVQFAHELQATSPKQRLWPVLSSWVASNFSSMEVLPASWAATRGAGGAATALQMQPAHGSHAARASSSRDSMFKHLTFIGLLSDHSTKEEMNLISLFVWVIFFAMICLSIAACFYMGWGEQEEEEESMRTGLLARFEARPPLPQPEGAAGAALSLLQTRPVGGGPGGLSGDGGGGRSLSGGLSGGLPGGMPGGLSMVPSRSGSDTPAMSVLSSEGFEPPPLLCPDRTLQQLETRLLLDMDALTNVGVGSRTVGAFSISRHKMLSVQISKGSAPVEGDESGNKSLAVSAPGSETDIIAYVANDALSSTSFKVFGRGGSLFGVLETSRLAATLNVNDRPVMRFTGQNAEATELVINAPNGHRLAEAGPASAEQKRKAGWEGNAWMVRVDAGVDPVLVCSCALALMVLAR
mmetsp:Transcript_19098/g.44940  ORF Transcript_19098/g.44940 Transcript_19098/m.44940 type:complete len:457 (-) Transcript_19098:238-1608(-)